MAIEKNFLQIIVEFLEENHEDLHVRITDLKFKSNGTLVEFDLVPDVGINTEQRVAFFPTGQSKPKFNVIC